MYVVQNEIRSSLVLSILQQLLQDDKDERVREATVRSLGLLTGFIDDADKYTQVGICTISHIGRVNSLMLIFCC